MSAIKVILSQEGYLVVLVREEAGVDRARLLLTQGRADGDSSHTHSQPRWRDIKRCESSNV
jgi:hypothetical protein